MLHTAAPCSNQTKGTAPSTGCCCSTTPLLLFSGLPTSTARLLTRSQVDHRSRGQSKLRKSADAAKPEDLFTGQWQNRPSVLDDYKSYLDDCWNEGFTNAWKLWEEIVPLGYKGSYQRVRAYLHKKRTSPRPVTARPPSPRTVSG